MTYDKSHGSPFDRGMADSYYRRVKAPHFMANGLRKSQDEMSQAEVDAYLAGYEYGEEMGVHKEY